MYKSAAFRDSRLSLQLGTSMWRLSLITFVFLLLTFMVGFFCMNVDTLKGKSLNKVVFRNYCVVCMCPLGISECSYGRPIVR